MRADVDTVADLGHRIYGGQLSEALIQRHRENLIDNFLDLPKQSTDIRSLIYVGENGKIHGFLGIIPRPLRFNGEAVIGALAGNLLVDTTSAKRFAGRHLLRVAMKGPQDVLFSDAASYLTRRLIIAAGGSESAPLSCHWLRPLRPLGLVLSRVKGSSPRMLLAKAGSRPAAILDRLSSRLPYLKPPPRPASLTLRDIDYDTLLETKATLEPKRIIQPDNDPWLSWALARVRRRENEIGRLRVLGAYDQREELVGWSVLCAKRGQIAELLDFGAKDNALQGLFDLVTREAWHAGATALGGRTDHRLLGIVSRSHCFFRPNDEWMLVHSRHPQIQDALVAGDTSLSRLDGVFPLMGLL